MPWKGNQYFYSNRILRTIATNYESLYQGLPLPFRGEITNPWALAEYKADFDRALNSIGKGKWIGEIDGHKFWDFKGFGKLQRIIIADMFGISDYEIAGVGFWDIPRLRGYAYYLMRSFLNGDERK